MFLLETGKALFCIFYVGNYALQVEKLVVSTDYLHVASLGSVPAHHCIDNAEFVPDGILQYINRL